MFGPQDVLMRYPATLFFILSLIIIGILVLVLKKGLLPLASKRRAGTLSTTTSIVRCPILTQNETAFFRSLQIAVGPQYLIFPQLLLRTFLKGSADSPSATVSFTNQIDRKRVDFVLADPQSLRVHLAIEVDDQSHAAEHRRQRDEFVEAVFEQAQITLVRIPAARSYDVSTLRQRLGLLNEQSETHKTAASF